MEVGRERSQVMTAGLGIRNQGRGIRTLVAPLSLPLSTSVGVCQAGPVWTPDPWGRNKPDAIV
jgi:hypothetical protein